jgi:hypothetical protein
MENVLLTFTGFQDPYALGLIGEEEQPGPILSLLATKSFDRVILFSTKDRKKHSRHDKIFKRIVSTTPRGCCGLPLGRPNRLSGNPARAPKTNSGDIRKNTQGALLCFGFIGNSANACLLGPARRLRRNTCSYSQRSPTTICF